jgi:hypothetical protein
MSLVTCGAAVLLLGQPQDSDKEPVGDPQLALWLAIKRGLLRGGSQYFEQSLKNAYVPGGANGVEVFRGTLISSTPPEHPNEFAVAMPDSATPEVTLKLKGRFAKPVEPGTPVTFQGIPTAFVSNPFMLTFEVEEIVLPSKRPGNAARKTPPPRPRAKQ